jgi:TonB family protein
MSLLLAVLLAAQTTPTGPSRSVSPTAGCNSEVMRLTSNGLVPSDPVPNGPQLVYTSVLVTVNPNGTVKSAALFQPSGRADSDENALQAAQAAKYHPKMVNCKPVIGNYLWVFVWTII